MVQEAPIASVAPHVPPAVPAGRAKGCGVPPPKANVPPAKAVLPVFGTVIVCAGLVVPAAQLPNAGVLGVTLALSAGVTVPANSTAPASTRLLVLRWVP